MLKKISIYICFIALVTCFFAHGSMAQAAEIEVDIVETSSTPIFVSGHEGDMSQIAGYQFEQNILVGGVVIGTSSGTVTLLAPPFDFTAPFSFGVVEATSSFPGLGTVEEFGCIIALTNSNTLSTGELTLSWTNSVSNGTESLSGIYGVATGMGTGNLFTSQGTMKQTYRYRFGY